MQLIGPTKDLRICLVSITTKILRSAQDDKGRGYCGVVIARW